jgi:hypothetical protein
VLLGLIWVVSLGFGVRALLSYESAPGGVGAVPKSWPANSKIQRATDRATLVMLAHPHCPCTRASVGELARLMAQVQGKATAYVIFLKPTNSGADWEESELRRSAAKIPGVTVLSDVDGAEAGLFGAETSGHTLLFGANGEQLFSGGITASRGHAGDNAGEDAIASLINNGKPARRSTLVFGCSLASRAAKGTACRN